MRVWAGKGKGSPSPVLDGFIPLATANKGHVECGLQRLSMLYHGQMPVPFLKIGTRDRIERRFTQFCRFWCYAPRARTDLVTRRDMFARHVSMLCVSTIRKGNLKKPD